MLSDPVDQGFFKIRTIVLRISFVFFFCQIECVRYKAVELISISFIKVFFPALYRLFPVIDRSGDLLFKPDQFLVTGAICAFLYISLQMLAAFDVPEVQLLVVIDCVVVVILK